jgi:hypothetical protein
LALAAFATTLGLGGGSAWAYFTSTGSGTGHATTGTPVTVSVNAASGSADLLPGNKGAVYFTLHNTNPIGASFTKVASVSSIVSNDTAHCPSADATVGQTLPYAFSPAVTVGANATSGTQSIANLVQLVNNAPSTCQGVTFTVTLTLSGEST